MRKFLTLVAVATLVLGCSNAMAQVVPQFRVTPNVNNLDPTQFDLSSQQQPMDPALFSALVSGERVSPYDNEVFLAKFGNRPATAQPFGPACPDLVLGGTAESEMCGDDLNGGCTPDEFCLTPGTENATAGGTFDGSVFADGDARDLDYWDVDVTSISTISATLDSELPCDLILIERNAAGDCTAPIILDIVNADCLAPATLTRTVVAGSYSLVVAPADVNGPLFNGFPCLANPGNQNDYTLSVSNASADCLTCVPSGAAEAELCVDGMVNVDTNGGCNNLTCGGGMDPCVELINVGDTVCGTTSTFIDPMTGGANRDTDWFEFNVAGPGATDITLTAVSEAPIIAFLSNNDCVTGPLVLGTDTTAGCTTATVLGAAVPPGNYFVIIVPGDDIGGIFAGIDCSDPAINYEFTVTTAPAACPTFCAFACGDTEGEACGTDINGGCNSVPEAFSTIGGGVAGVVVAETVCGTSFADAGTRDTDWWELPNTIGTPIAIDVEVTTNLSSGMPVVDGSGNVAGVGIFLISEVAGLQGPPGMFGNGCADIQFLATAFAEGNCVPVSLTATLPADPSGTPMRHIIFVGAVDGPAFGGAFAGVPCNCGAQYTLSVAPAAAAPCIAPTLQPGSEANCSTGDATFVLLAQSNYDTLDVEVFDAAGMSVGTDSQMNIVQGATTVSNIGLAGDGIYTATVTVTCNGGADMDTFDIAPFTLATYNGEDDVIFANDLSFDNFAFALFAGPGGCIDGPAALEAALTAAGRSVKVIPFGPGAWLDTDNTGAPMTDCFDLIAMDSKIWVHNGTFPNSGALSIEDGLALVDAVSGNHPTGAKDLYLQGGDTWGVDALTDINDWDGVEGLLVDGNLILDGDDTCIAVNGVGTAATADTTALGNMTYSQDNLNTTVFAGDDFTDQLIPSSGTDLPAGSTFESILDDDLSGGSLAVYSVAVAKNPNDPAFGRVVSTSIELGGLSDVSGYTNAILTFFGVSGGPTFIRGDNNNDNAVNIADAIALLGVLFPTMVPAPTLSCEDTGDSNDDGTVNIADAIALLGSLFGMPTVPLPFPNITDGCGADPTMDSLSCPNSSGMCP